MIPASPLSGRAVRSRRIQPIPFDVVESELNPLVSVLLGLGELLGELSVDPYTLPAINLNLTDLQDFILQYTHVVDRLVSETASSGVSKDLFLLTLPYYSAIGYLLDSEDLEFYLRKVNPGYSMPPTFSLVAPVGQPVTDPLRGDRISLLTFGMMYALLSSGHTVDDLNRALETGGLQRYGLLLSEAEQQVIMSRIDAFNDTIRAAGLGYEGEGITGLLFLLKDPDDTNPDVQVAMPPNVWDIISNVLLSEILDIPALQAAAEQLGTAPLEQERGFHPQGLQK